MTATLYLIRHGQSEGNVKGIMQGSLDMPLTVQGFAQAQKIAARLAAIPLDAIHSSPQQRAAETAHCIARAQSRALELMYDKRLREQNMGRLEGMSLGQARSEEQARGVMSLQDGEEDHGGESTAQVRDRAREFIRDALLGGEYAHAAIVSHGNTLGILLCEMLQMSAQSHHPFNFPNAALATARREGTRFRLLTLADVSHLLE